MVLDFALAGIALVALIMFAVVHVIAFRRSASAPADLASGTERSALQSEDKLVTAGTSLASLVAGIVAVFFGIEPDALMASVNLRKILELIYVFTYVTFGLVAWFVWISKAEGPHAVIRNLAQSFQGIVIPLAVLFLNGNSSIRTWV